jgi:hypothetical protein
VVWNGTVDAGGISNPCAISTRVGGHSARFDGGGWSTNARMTAGLIFVGVWCWTRWVHKNQYVAFKLNTHVLDNSTVVMYPNKKCVRLLKQSGEGEHVKKGTILLPIDYCRPISQGNELIAMVIRLAVALCGEICSLSCFSDRY